MSVALFILAAAVPASAYSTHDTRLAIEQFGRCIAARQERSASAAIVRNADNGTLIRDYSRLIDGGCMPTPPQGAIKVKFVGDQFRYALADGLVRRQLLSLPAPVLDGVAPLDHREPKEPSRVDRKGRPLSEARYAEAVKNYEQAQAFAYVSRFGECVVRANPSGARALLATAADSAQEKAAFADLSTAMGNCLEEGSKIELSKLVLRGTIAVNYYRLAAAAGFVGSGKVTS